MYKLLSLIMMVTITACADNGKLVEQLQKSASAALNNGGLSALTSEDIVAGLKEALNQSTGNVVAQLGEKDGFSKDELIRIQLPESLLKAKRFAGKLGLDRYFVDLENRLNTAAEVATPLAKDLFIGAIKNMEMADAKAILQGPDNAATMYFQEKTSDQLKMKMRPIVNASLEQVGAVRSLNSLLDAYKKLPFAPEIKTDLTQHVVDGGVRGIFHYVAVEEKAIRDDPLKRSTALLRRVFASQ